MSDSGSESSPEESGTNTPSMTESGTVTPSTMGTGSKKFDFLLQQTELFSHFMGSNQKVRSIIVKFLIILDDKILNTYEKEPNFLHAAFHFLGKESVKG